MTAQVLLGVIRELDAARTLRLRRLRLRNIRYAWLAGLPGDSRDSSAASEAPERVKHSAMSTPTLRRATTTIRVSQKHATHTPAHLVDQISRLFAV